MKEKSTSTWAWIALVLVAALYLAGIVLELVNDPPPDPPAGWEGERGALSEYLFIAMSFSFPAVGAVIASRQPGNTIGWIMLGIGAAAGFSEISEGYARYGLTTQPGALPGAEVALALTAGSWALVIAPIGTFLILLFPDGRLPSRRWRPVAVAAGLGIALTYGLITLAPLTFPDLGYPQLENPLGVEALRPHLDLFLSVIVLIPLSIIGSAAGLISRFRRSRGQERLQMKWLAAAGAIVALVYGITMAVSLTTNFRDPADTPEWMLRLQELSLIAFALIPVAIGVAVLRHKLYDIDIIINRTIVYAILTAALTGFYLVGVAVLQGVFRPVTGESQLAVAVSTLAVAALFRPVRSVIQTFIDRRFYRQRYDAALTLETFSHRLRDEVDIRTITPTLVGVVSEALQPTHVSLWVRETSQQ
ncbi:MAG: hypothetical protein M3N53_03170 [Actinomycetota bacterium]|nr:hypothetical protein [Actinomycetota bacterium]